MCPSEASEPLSRCDGVFGSEIWSLIYKKMTLSLKNTIKNKYMAFTQLIIIKLVLE